MRERAPTMARAENLALDESDMNQIEYEIVITKPDKYLYQYSYPQSRGSDPVLTISRYYAELVLATD